MALTLLDSWSRTAHLKLHRELLFPLDTCGTTSVALVSGTRGMHGWLMQGYVGVHALEQQLQFYLAVGWRIHTACYDPGTSRYVPTANIRLTCRLLCGHLLRRGRVLQ